MLQVSQQCVFSNETVTALRRGVPGLRNVCPNEMSLSSVERRSQPSPAPVKVVVDVRSTCITEANNVGGRPARGTTTSQYLQAAAKLGTYELNPLVEQVV